MKLECYMKEMEGQLSPSQKKICSFLLEHRGQAAMLTVQELANTCQVSIATASRFVKQLGFGSYGEFQNELQNEVLKKIGTVDKIRNTAASEEMNSGFIHAALKRDRMTMETEEGELKEDTIAAIADTIHGAKTVYLAGLGSSRALVDFLNYRFCWMGIPTRKLTAGGSEFMEQLVFLSEGDVLISVGFRKTYREISIAMSYAEKKGIPIIGIAESHLSEIMSRAKLVMPVKRGPEEEWNSLAYPMAACNILVKQVLERRTEQALKTAGELQWLNEQLNNNR